MQFRITLHDVYETGKIFHIEAQTMHTRIYLNMDIKLRNFRMTCQHLFQLLQIVEVEDFRFQTMVHHHLKAMRLSPKHNNRSVDTALAQTHTLIRISHGKVINTLVQQSIHQFHIAQTVGRGFHHRHHLRIGTQTITMVIEIVG